MKDLYTHSYLLTLERDNFTFEGYFLVMFIVSLDGEGRKIEGKGNF